jgi:tetratricopeptide (TPR) repeat protein
MTVSDRDPSATPSESSGVDRQLHAQDSNRVYQAAGDQHFHERAAPAPAKVTDTLPRDTAAFIGRDRELHGLITTVTDAAASGEVIPIHAIDGMPGVGKTAFAIHVGHLLAGSFPDGQLFIDLHAHTARQGPVEPADALFALLSADGILPEQIPAGLDERAARWRARMAGKKVLLVMDNAAAHAQVESLVPGAAGCLVLITSRRRLPGLGVRHAAMTLSLGTLPPDDAAALFIRLTGRHRTAETAAVADLVRLCGYLPLAISLLAAKLRPEPGWRVADIVGDLVATHDRLAPMQAEDIEVKAAFDLSYHALPANRRRFFRRLGLHPGTDLDTYAAAAINGVNLSAAREHLTALYNDHLIDQPVRGRYWMHDLIGDYARMLLSEDAPADRAQAVNRVLDYYQHTAYLADRHLSSRVRKVSSVPEPPGAVPDIWSADRAMAWLATERANLLGCTTHAEGTEQHARLVGFAAGLATFLRRTGPWRQAVELHRAAAAAAGHLGDPAALADALHSLGIVLRRAGDYPNATRALMEAAALYQELDERLQAADVLNELSVAYRLIENFPFANDAVQLALAAHRDMGDRRGLAGALNNLAAIRWLTDDCAGANQALQEALQLYDQLDDRCGQAFTLFNLGVVRRMTGDYSRATRVLQEALALYEAIGDLLGQANVRHNLGVVQRMTEDYAGATQALEEALGLYLALGDRLGQANASKHLGIVRYLDGDLPGAAAALGEAMALYRELGDRLGEAGALYHLGILVWRLGADFPRSMELLREALDRYRTIGSRLGQAEVHNHTGVVLLEHGQPGQAAVEYRLALQFAREANSSIEEAHALEGGAHSALQMGDNGTAIEHLREALRIYQRVNASDAERIVAKLKELNRPLAS